MMDHKRIHLIIHGRVQGVGYRYYTQREAKTLGLTGWVRNLPDNTVELIAEGKQSSLDALLKWCQKGPPAAEVSEVNSEWLVASGEFEGFVIRRS